jgi:hypothetical protein
MNFSYAESFGASSANGYERLLLDAMLGDGTLFAHRDGVEATWALMTPLLEAWAKTAGQGLPQLRGGKLGAAGCRCHDEVGWAEVATSCRQSGRKSVERERLRREGRACR